jgi:hypothetical protein
MYQNTENYNYTVRGQMDYNKYLDVEKKHFINAAGGGEISSAQYFGLSQTYRGYLKERGKKMAGVDAVEYPAFAQWLSSDPAALGVWQDKITNRVGGYATLSYTYNNNYTLNANIRADASNRFGSRANERLAPVYSFSGRWNVKNTVLHAANWVDALDLRASFGFQGNMVERISSQLILQREGIDADFGGYESSVYSYANPDLRWEKTASYNASLDFSLFRKGLQGSMSYFYKKTMDAFLNKNISSINGIGQWTVNEGELENQGIELSLTFTPIDTRSRNVNGFRWSMTTNFGRVMNNVSGRDKDKTLTSRIDYNGYLNGTLEIQGRPLNSFYSYQYLHLNPLNGAPVFYGSEQVIYVNNQRIDLLEKYKNMELTDIYSDVLTYSGTRVPIIQGSVFHNFAWRRFSMSLTTSYSFGSKIRLLKMYPNVSSEYLTIAPQPTANVRKEFLDRWRNPGDELYTNIPGVVSGSDFQSTFDNRMWWGDNQNIFLQPIQFADNIWTMYDKSDLRVVSGNFVKIQSMSLRYNLPENFCKKLSLRSAYLGLSGTNLYTFASSRLKGQDPASQDGTAPTINMSLRPTYSFMLNVSF